MSGYISLQRWTRRIDSTGPLFIAGVALAGDCADDSADDRAEERCTADVVVALMAFMTVVAAATRGRRRRHVIRRTDRVMVDGSLDDMVRHRLRHGLGNDLVLHRLGDGLRHGLSDLNHRRLALGHRHVVVLGRRESRTAQRDTSDTGHHHLRNNLVHITPTFLRFMR